MCNQDRTCWTCAEREGEECGYDGHEVYDDGIDRDCHVPYEE